MVRPGVDDIDRILFELSSNRRTAILEQIGDSELKMQEVARKLDMNVTETFRHLQRLSEARLVQRRASGGYGLTPLGKLGMSLRSGFAFISINAKYFSTHHAMSVPYEFVGRIGELSKGEAVPNVLTSLNFIAKLAAEAQGYLWTISDEVEDTSAKIALERIRKKELSMRLILPEEYVSRYPSIPGIEDRLERRFLPEIPLILGVSDKAAHVAFPSTQGKLDYTGFMGSDSKFVKWARDLYLYEWEIARPRKPKITSY